VRLLYEQKKSPCRLLKIKHRRRALGFRNFENLRLRVKVLCG
jgi:hypothetical protein